MLVPIVLLESWLPTVLAAITVLFVFGYFSAQSEEEEKNNNTNINTPHSKA
ncbi:hypothetical protein [Necropsobacter massiliensis]|uniref:hypothetical protein n=1 Tax=Necropsobacter massiliensis TaxID=1400001 RepID=UPI000A8D0446|nr:hypothetical protein [Necropsobacter massiliensis]